MIDNQNTHIIEQAAALLGSKSELARQLGVRPQSGRKWVRYDRIPAEQCIPIERVTQSRITRYQLRPDLYPA